MASTSVSRILPAFPERVWQLIGGFHALPDRSRSSRKALHWRAAESVAWKGTRRTAGAIQRTAALLHLLHRRSTLRGQRPPRDPAGVSGARAKQAAEVVWTVRFQPEGITDAEAAALFDGFSGMASMRCKAR